MLKFSVYPLSIIAIFHICLKILIKRLCLIFFKRPSHQSATPLSFKSTYFGWWSSLFFSFHIYWRAAFPVVNGHTCKVKSTVEELLIANFISSVYWNIHLFLRVHLLLIIFSSVISATYIHIYNAQAFHFSIWHEWASFRAHVHKVFWKYYEEDSRTEYPNNYPKIQISLWNLPYFVRIFVGSPKHSIWF